MCDTLLGIIQLRAWPRAGANNRAGANSTAGTAAMFSPYGHRPKTQANWSQAVFQVHPGKATRKVRCKSGAVPQL